MSAANERWQAEWKSSQQLIKISELSSEELLSCLRKQRRRGWAYLHFALRFGNYGDMEEVLSRLSSDTKYELLKGRTNNTKSTLLMFLMGNSTLWNSSQITSNSTGLMELIFGSMSNNKIFQLSNMTNQHQYNLVWHAVYYNHLSTAERLLQLVGPAQQLKLIGVDWRMNSATEENKLASPIEEAKKKRKCRRLLEMLEAMKTDALVSVTLEDPSHPGIVHMLHCLVHVRLSKLKR